MGKPSKSQGYDKYRGGYYPNTGVIEIYEDKTGNKKRMGRDSGGRSF